MFQNISSSYEELFTFQDAVERVLTTVGARGGHPGELASARNAVIDAMRELPGKFSWNYYKRALQITTTSPVYNLVGAYVHTGGAVERQLTLTTGTWPANAASGQVSMLNTIYRIGTRVSDTVIQLAENTNPGRDLSSQGLTLVYTAYPLGTRVRRIQSLQESQTDLPIDYASHQDVLQFQHINPVPSTPVLFNIHQSGSAMNLMELEFAPPPLDQRTYTLSIEAQPRQLRTHEDELTVTTSGTTVTATVGTFKSRHLGSVIRFSSDSTEPTGTAGQSDSYNPYVEQKVIKSITNSTTAVIDSALAENLTGVSAIVTDPLDVDHNTLLGLVIAMATKKFAQFSPNSQRLEEFIGMENRALADAISSNDYVSTDMLTQSGLLGMPDIDFILEFPN